jgi:phage terminase large subunit GpA-like protein
MHGLSEIFAEAGEMWKPRPPVSAMDWAHRNIELDRRFSPRPGKYDVEYTPYLRQLHEWFSDPKIRQITLCKGAQLGGTTWLANCIMYCIAENPGPILYVTSTNENAKSWSERELMPRFKACPAVYRLKPENEDDFRKTEMHFQTCTLKLVGSNSEGNLASRPVRYLFADEVDKWPDQSGVEAPALDLAITRTNFYRAICKRILTSTPTVESGAIWREYLKGSQHKFHIACPHCGERHPLEFENIKWPAELRDLLGVWDLDLVARDAWYECPACKERWQQRQQPQLVRAGVWKPTNLRAPSDHISAHISSLYSPQMTWGELAKIFLQKKNTPGGLHDFRNSYEGLPFTEKAAEVAEEDITKHRADYAFGIIVPQKPAAILLGADVHQAHTNYVVRAFSDQAESWLVDYGKVAGVDDLVVWAAGQSYDGAKITAGLVDSGYATETVYRACAEAARKGVKLLPAKGSGEKFLTKPVRVSDISIGGKTFRKSLVIYSDVDFKRQLYLEIIKEGKLPWWIPASTGSDYTEELLRERMVLATDSRGYENPIWKRFGANHYADCEKLTLVYWMASR